MKGRVRVPRFLSRIWLRLLAFNVLLVFLPVAGVLVLDTYENDLLQAQERTMTQAGRLLAAALEATGRLTAEDARRILVELSQRQEARLRVVDREGRLLADSARLGPRREPEEPTETGDRTQAADRGLLYRLGSLPFRIWRRLHEVPSAPSVRDDYDTSSVLLGPEVVKALEGRYGAATRIGPSDLAPVTLYSAIPIRAADGTVIGAVLVSQSTYRVMRTLDSVRVGVFEVFLASLAVAMLLSLVTATTIARPLARLRRRAGAILDRKGRLRGSFPVSGRSDEIGDLELALADLTRRLEEHLQYIESFVSDVAHEFRNPLASIASATEMALEADDPRSRRRFLAMIEHDVRRMERLLADAREVSRIEARLEEEDREEVELSELLTVLVESLRMRLGPGGPQVVLAVAEHDLVVSAAPERLGQVFDNLLENAVSFSPEGGSITVTLSRDGDHAVITVADEGPGIPDEHAERVFTRFFSYRPAEADARDHTGLGLATVRAIVDGYGGSVTLGNRPNGGAIARVSLPRVPSPGSGRSAEPTPSPTA